MKIINRLRYITYGYIPKDGSLREWLNSQKEEKEELSRVRILKFLYLK